MALTLVFLVNMLTYLKDSSNANASKTNLPLNQLQSFSEVYLKIKQNFVQDISDKELFEPKYLMTKNEDEFNWSKLIPNNDFAAICKTSFIFHYKGVSTINVFDNYNKISNDVKEWRRQRKLIG